MNNESLLSPLQKNVLNKLTHNLNFGYKYRCKFKWDCQQFYIKLYIEPIFILNPDDLRKKRKHCDTDGLDFHEYMANLPIYSMGSPLEVMGTYYGMIGFMFNLLDCRNKHDILMICQYLKFHEEHLSMYYYLYTYDAFHNTELDRGIKIFINENNPNFEEELIKHLFSRFTPTKQYNPNEFDYSHCKTFNVRHASDSQWKNSNEAINKYGNLD